VDVDAKRRALFEGLTQNVTIDLLPPTTRRNNLNVISVKKCSIAVYGKNKKNRKAKFKLHKIQSGIISYYTWLNLYFVGLVLPDFVTQFV